MAKIISESLGKEIEIEDGNSLRCLEKEFGLAFGCKDGVCGTCAIEVTEGMENLSPKNDKEEEFGIEGQTRFACQCKVINGTVKIKHYI